MLYDNLLLNNIDYLTLFTVGSTYIIYNTEIVFNVLVRSELPR